MTSNKIPVLGKFKVTAEYKKQGDMWVAGWHTGVDLVGLDSKNIYNSCDGNVVRTGFDDLYGNYIVIKDFNNQYHWFCHLSKILVEPGHNVNGLTWIGVMGATGNTTGEHLHYEIRQSSNKYAETINPCDYMGIPNKEGLYDSLKYYRNDMLGIYKVVVRSLRMRTSPDDRPKKKVRWGGNIITNAKKDTQFDIKEIYTYSDQVWGRAKQGWLCIKNAQGIYMKKI